MARGRRRGSPSSVTYRGFTISAYDRKKQGAYGGFILTDLPLDPIAIGYLYDSKADVIKAGKRETDRILDARAEHEDKARIETGEHRSYSYLTGKADRGWFAGGDRMPWRGEDDDQLSLVQGDIGSGYSSRAAAVKAVKKLIDLVVGGKSYADAKQAVGPKKKAKKKAAKRKTKRNPDSRATLRRAMRGT